MPSDDGDVAFHNGLYRDAKVIHGFVRSLGWGEENITWMKALPKKGKGFDFDDLFWAYKNNSVYNPDHRLYASESNVKREIQTLVAEAKPGDVLFLYFTGHGSSASVLTLPNGRVEGWWLAKHFADCIPKGVTAFVMFDACRSGLIMPLPYHLQDGEWAKGKDSESSKNKKETGHIIYISGCRQSERSATGRAGGRLTNHFLNLVHRQGKGSIALPPFLVKLQKKVGRRQTPQMSQFRGTTRPHIG